MHFLKLTLPFCIRSCAADAFFCCPVRANCSPSFFCCFSENNLIITLLLLLRTLPYFSYNVNLLFFLFAAVCQSLFCSCCFRFISLQLKIRQRVGVRALARFVVVNCDDAFFPNCATYIPNISNKTSTIVHFVKLLLKIPIVQHHKYFSIILYRSVLF